MRNGRKYWSMGSVAVAGLLALASASSASAAVVTIDGVSFSEDGAVFKSAQIWEDAVKTPGETLQGFGIVLSITGADCGGLCWVTGTNSTELTFTFEYTLERIVALDADTAEAWFSGGIVNMYADDSPNFTFGFGASEAADLASATDGDPWLNLIGAGTGTVCGALDFCDSGIGTVITLESQFEFGAGDLAAVLEGDGSGFLDVLLAGSGSANSYFDRNNQPSGQDILLTSSFAKSDESKNWDIEGTANLRTKAIPEPGTLALLGAGLLSLAWIRRRRNARA